MVADRGREVICLVSNICITYLGNNITQEVHLLVCFFVYCFICRALWVFHSIHDGRLKYRSRHRDRGGNPGRKRDGD